MIAIVYPQFYGVGGIARYLDSFLKSLPEQHPPIYLIIGDEFKDSQGYRGVEIIHIPFTSNRISLLIWTIKVRKILIQLHKQGKIEWVNLHIPPLISGLLLPKKIPLVLTTHTTYLGMSGRFYSTQYYQSQWNWVSVKIKYWMECRIFKHATKMIVLTEQARQEVMAYSYKNAISVIPNGVALDKFVPNPLVMKDIDVLFCGRIETRKGSRAMVQLCKLLIEENTSIRICIVGYGEDQFFVQEHLSVYKDNILLTGKLSFEQTITYYQRSNIYVSTSYYEGLPGTCLEAMAMELPVVVWNFLFYRDLVITNQTGILVNANDIQAMSKEIQRLLANVQLRVEFGKNARKRLLNSYGWEHLAVRVLAVFNA